MATELLEKIKELAPNVSFEAGEHFCWSPASTAITFATDSIASDKGTWSLLHEVAHSILGHLTYKSDLELVLMEVAAWEKAQELASKLAVAIDANHVQDCLDTYRDWLHRRSTCPTCGAVSLQTSSTEYQCHNCNKIWRVTAARFCRPYRISKI